MNDVARVEVVSGAEQLVHDEALVHLLQDVALPAMRNGLSLLRSFLILTDATLLRIIRSSLHLRRLFSTDSEYLFQELSTGLAQGCENFADKARLHCSGMKEKEQNSRNLGTTLQATHAYLMEFL